MNGFEHWPDAFLEALLRSLHCLAVHPGGKRLATGGTDGSIKLWDLTTGHELLTLWAHQSPIFFLEFCAEGRRLVSAADGDKIRFWDAPELTPDQQAQFIVRELHRTIVVPEDLVSAVEKRADLSLPVRTAALRTARNWQPSMLTLCGLCMDFTANPKRY